MPPLLRAANHERGGHDAVRAHERARAARPVELVGRDREQVEAIAREVDGEVACGLHGVGVEERAALADGAADVTHGLHRAHLVVGVHDGDEARVVAKGHLHGRDAHDAVGVGAHEGDVEVSAKGAVRRGETLERPEDARVLDGRGHDVAPARPGAVGSTREQGLVVGLGAAGGELDLAWLGVEARRDARAGVLKRAECRVSRGVLAHGVGESRALVDAAHRRQCGGGGARGRGIVEVDELVRFHLSHLPACAAACGPSREPVCPWRCGRLRPLMRGDLRPWRSGLCPWRRGDPFDPQSSACP